MNESADKGMLHLKSLYTVDQTVERLETILSRRGIRILARIDHSGDAEQSGLAMRPTKLVIFGNPKVGTPLMIAAPTIAIDLPLKALVWEDSDAHVWLTHNASEYLSQRHSVPPELLHSISAMGALFEEAVQSGEQQAHG